MTSRERIITACNHKEPDKVPIDIGSMRSTGLSAIAFNALNAHLGYNETCYMYDFQQQLAYTGNRVRERFNVDSMDVGEIFINDVKWKNWKLPDGTSCKIPEYMDVRIREDNTICLHDSSGILVGIQPKRSLYVNQVYFPYKEYEEIPDVLDPKEFEHTMWDVPCLPFNLDIVFNDEHHEKFVKRIREFRAKTDKALMISIGQSFLEFGGYIRSPENFLCDIYTDPEGTQRLLNVLQERYILKLKRILADVADCVDIVQFGDDLGTQAGPWMNPNHIKDVFVPHYKALWDVVHSMSDCKVFMHCCGSIAPVLGHLIDAGLDIINPVQTTAANMDPEMLKREFGKHLTFWGGACETQGVLTTGTPEQVKEQAKRRIEILAKDGGFVFNQIHNILANVPPENIVALYDAASEFGVY